MNRYTIIAVAAAYSALAGLAGAQAAESGKQKPIEVIMQLSTKGGELAITPSDLKLQTGKLYKLVINNPSNSTHYLSVPRFGNAVRTAKIDVQGGEVIRTGFQRSRRPIVRRSAVFSHKVKEIAVRPGGWRSGPSPPSKPAVTRWDAAFLPTPKPVWWVTSS